MNNPLAEEKKDVESLLIINNMLRDLLADFVNVHARTNKLKKEAAKLIEEREYKDSTEMLVRNTELTDHLHKVVSLESLRTRTYRESLEAINTQDDTVFKIENNLRKRRRVTL